jgi:hypothetical protein
MGAGQGLELELDLASELEAHLRPLRRSLGKDCPSEYSFSNLYLFRRPHRYRYVPGSLPCVAGITYDGARHLLPLFPLEAASPSALAALLDGHDCFYPVPARTLQGLDPRLLQWTELRDDADYLYRAEAFVGYRGRRLRKKRNLMNQLLSSHRVSTEALARTGLPGALRILQGWMRDKSKREGEADEAECREALDAADALGLEGRVYLADGAPAGFILAERLADGVHAIRFAKGLDAFPGIYQFMFHEFCASGRAGSAVEWLNFEQDLGLPNFRRTKLSYEPHALLRKYRVAFRPP